MKCLIVGFDARESALDGTAWSDQRKAEWLLFRRDVVRPLSVDTVVWPSLLDSEGSSRPSYIGLFYPWWEDLERLSAHVRQDPACRLRRGDLVACGVWIDAGRSEDVTAWSDFLPPEPGGGPPRHILATPSSVHPDWRFLGYDVADRSGAGVLSGMRPPEASREIGVLSGTWGPHLNHAHLFDDLEAARRFKGDANRRIPKHAPFFVYGLWWIQRSDAV